MDAEVKITGFLRFHQKRWKVMPARPMKCLGRSQVQFSGLLRNLRPLPGDSHIRTGFLDKRQTGAGAESDGAKKQRNKKPSRGSLPDQSFTVNRTIEFRWWVPAPPKLQFSGISLEPSCAKNSEMIHQRQMASRLESRKRSNDRLAMEGLAQVVAHSKINFITSWNSDP